MRRLFFLFLWVVCTSFFAFSRERNSKDFYFLSPADCQAIVQSSKTIWGRKILENLQKTVGERRKHSLVVPTIEAGHLHHYYCPVHNMMFTFDFDKPHAQYCTACGKYWENVNRYDWAWIYRLHRENQNYLTACMYLYIATGKRRYAEYIKDMMLDYAAKYLAYQIHDAERKPTSEHSGKLFAQSLDEGNWMSEFARPYVAIKDALTQEERCRIEKGIFRPCANLLLSRKGENNWRVWHNSGLIAAGVALENDSIINFALNDAKMGYKSLMKSHVNPDGWWDEGSCHYHYYTLRGLMLSAEAVRCRGINLYDEQFRSMFSGPVHAAYDNLTLPSHNDGWYGPSLISSNISFYEIAYARYADPLFKRILEKAYSHVPRLSPEALLDNLPIVPDSTPLNQPGFLFPSTGFAVLRNLKNQATVLKYGSPGIGGHGHLDKLSLIVYNGNKELISDLGTPAYGLPEYLTWYKRTLSHNTVTIDYKDQSRTEGKLVYFENQPEGGIVEAVTDGAYPGVTIRRRIELRGNRLSDLYTCFSEMDHVYDFVLLFNEKPELEGTSVPAELNESDTYRCIREVKKYLPGKIFTIVSNSGKTEIQVLDGNSVEVFSGEAPGIPPQEYGNKPVQTCYPVIIRITGCRMSVQSVWKL